MNANEYVICNSILKPGVVSMIDEFSEEFMNMSGKCMDLGSGPGYITKNILVPALNPNAIVIGTDLLDDMIKYANKRYGDEQLKFEVLDILTKELPKKYINEFNHILSFNAMQYFTDIWQACKNIYDMIRPGGSMFSLVVQSSDVFDIIKSLSQNIHYAPYIPDTKKFLWPFHNSKYPHKELKKLLRSIGFEVYHCSHRERIYSAKDLSILASLVMSFITCLFNEMPYDIMERFKNDFKNEYIRSRITSKEPRNKEEMIEYDLHTVVVVYAKKPL